ncbi:MAG: endonuclease domain-containing protein [Bacteroidales bacterium]|nr:endonuclease domain-containing protein [Bacteroidales bacterium]
MKRRKIIAYNPKLKEYARQLRNNSTKSEIILWKYLKGKQMMGYDFHRQKPLNNFIVDFFCHELMLSIEIDGYTHLLEEVQIKDAEKEKKLNELGIHVLRFPDSDVYEDIENVLREIEGYIVKYERTHPRQR